MAYAPDDNGRQQLGRALLAAAALLALMGLAAAAGLHDEGDTVQAVLAAGTFGVMAGLAGFAGRKLILAWRADTAIKQRIAAQYAAQSRAVDGVDLHAIALENRVDQASVRRAIARARWLGMVQTPAPPGVRVDQTGVVQRPGDLYGMYVITLGIYTFFWVHRVIAELERHNPGAAGVTARRAVEWCLIPGFNLYWLPRLYFLITSTINERYQRFPDSDTLMNPRAPVIAYVAMNFIPLLSIALIPVALLLLPIPMGMVQGALNRYWLICRGSHSPASPTAGPA